MFKLILAALASSMQRFTQPKNFVLAPRAWVKTGRGLNQRQLRKRARQGCKIKR